MDARDFQDMNDRNKGFKRSQHQFYPNPWTTKPGSNNNNINNTPNNYERKEILNQVLEGLK